MYCGRRCQKSDWPDHKAAHGCTKDFDVQIALLSGVTLIVRGCAEKLKISALKAKIEEMSGILSCEQALCLGTKVLMDGDSLLKAGVTKASCVSLVQEERPPPLVDSSSEESLGPASTVLFPPIDLQHRGSLHRHGL